MTCKTTGLCVATDRCPDTLIAVRPRGVITTDRVAALERLLDLAMRQARQRGTQAVLDLSEVQLLGAAAVGAVVRRRRRLLIRNASPSVRRQLDLLRLHERLDEEAQQHPCP